MGGFKEVGRSSMLLQTPNSRVLLDCGVNVAASDNKNAFPYLNVPEFSIEELDAVIISHAHLDHCGFVPYLYHYGYDVKHVQKAIKHTITLDYGEVTDISPDIRLTLHNAGHILGSAISHMHIGDGAHNLV
mgnify:CR=1 FL=1